MKNGEAVANRVHPRDEMEMSKLEAEEEDEGAIDAN